MTAPVTVAELQILAVLARAGTVDHPAASGIERGRTKPVSEYPALVLREGEEGPPAYNSATEVYVQPLSFDGWVKAPTRQAAMAEARLLAGLLQQALMSDEPLAPGWSDTRFVGLTVSGDHGATDQVANFDLGFEVEYETAHGDPFTPGTI